MQSGVLLLVCSRVVCLGLLDNPVHIFLIEVNLVEYTKSPSNACLAANRLPS